MRQEIFIHLDWKIVDMKNRLMCWRKREEKKLRRGRNSGKAVGICQDIIPFRSISGPAKEQPAEETIVSCIFRESFYPLIRIVSLCRIENLVVSLSIFWSYRAIALAVSLTWPWYLKQTMTCRSLKVWALSSHILSHCLIWTLLSYCIYSWRSYTYFAFLHDTYSFVGQCPDMSLT